jgi:receptor-type tyrosine-protein phosphatase eta
MVLDIIETQLRQEFDSLKCKKSCDYNKFMAAFYPQNMCKNRYYNILPNEESRVKLNALVDGDGDYINANFVGCENFRRNYILTQAPLPNTVNDLWRMVWQEKVPVIVCLTKLNEGEVQKAHKYWPDDGQTMQYGKIIVYNSMTVMYSNIAIRSFTLWMQGDILNSIEVFHLHYQDWPDHGTPSSTKPIRTLAYLVTTLRERCRSGGASAGPAVVHCSAGVGRAGTFVAIHMILTQLEKMALSQPCLKIPINVKEIVARLRSQREGTVQTADQYIFIYKVIADSLSLKRNSLNKPLESDHYILSLQDSPNHTPTPAEAFFLDILSLRPTKCWYHDDCNHITSAEVR